MILLAGGPVEGRKKLFAIYQQRIEAAWPGLGKCLVGSNSGELKLDLSHHGHVVKDLKPLQGMLLHILGLGDCSQIKDLSPLQGMPLTTLTLNGCILVPDITPLRGMPLTTLAANGCTQVRDLTPLEGMNLVSIYLTPKNITKGVDVLRRMKSLQSIGTHWTVVYTPEEFWKAYDAGKFR